MLQRDINYLDSIPDKRQYLAAHCGMDRNVFMFDRESTGSVEAMKHANEKVCNAFSVDIVNATIVLLKMESVRFKKQQTLAWKREETFTPHGEDIMKKISKKIDHCDYVIAVTEQKCQVRRIGRNNYDL